MSLESGRSLMQGVMLIVFAGIALWVSKPVGVALVAFMAVLKLQESLTDWCPSDLFFKPMGLKRRAAAKR